jgi:hypothetical protein
VEERRRLVSGGLEVWWEEGRRAGDQLSIQNSKRIGLWCLDELRPHDADARFTTTNAVFYFVLHQKRSVTSCQIWPKISDVTS